MGWRRSERREQEEPSSIELDRSLWLMLGEFPAAGLALRETLEALHDQPASPVSPLVE